MALASTKYWPAYREHHRQTTKRLRGDWVALLLDAHDCQSALLQHFSSIFSKADRGGRSRGLHQHVPHTDNLMQKHRWIPFTHQELLIVSSRWGKHICTGVDGIAHEALQMLIQHPVWGARVLAMLNEALYTGKLPTASQCSSQIKGGNPASWGNTPHHTQQRKSSKPWHSSCYCGDPFPTAPQHLPMGST